MIQHHLIYVGCLLLLLCLKSYSIIPNGTYTVLEGGENIQLVYQIPPIINGILFVAHGCSHAGTDWFPKSKYCLKCIGLPVELSIVQKALENDIAVLAVSAADSQHKCWVPREDSGS
mmetsp:Transcript_6967/g.7084  ORF Transcript_6967/g.7084 Transcript_6967/m.7084 type:complete len:117 (-) Transcript_6967:1044-1394(-)